MTTVLWIIAAIVIVNILLVTFWYFFRDKEEKPSVEPVEKPSEHIQEPEPTTEPEKPVESKFKVGDYVVGDYGSGRIVEITDDSYLLDTGIGLFFTNNSIRLWDITTDAKDGDVLVGIDEDFTSTPWIGIFKCINNDYPDRMFDSHCFLQAGTHTFISPEIESHYENPCEGHSSRFAVPATKEQRDLLFTKMAEAGYTWDAETKTLKDTHDQPSTETAGNETQVSENEDDQRVNSLVEYFSTIVPIGEKTGEYLRNIRCNLDIFSESNFPCIYDYYGKSRNPYYREQMIAYLYGLILAELVPEKRQQLMQMAYDYMVQGVEQPTYGWTFETDPNIARMMAAAVYATTRDASIIPELRKELGGKMLTYKNDISECYIDTTKFMPTAPPPFIKGYEKRPKGTPVDADNTACVDEQINDHVAQYYNLDTKDAEKRQATIQAIANKEYHKQHLFGKDRTVTDKMYGTMTIHPVFGKHNLGIEIPDDGAIANLVYDMGKICSATRISLLNQEYGRKRPGMGDTDGSMNPDERHRALVNYPLEEGDGHTTGYYDKGGYYVDGNGNYIGDYNTYYQGQLYANSYPSGHSAFIIGVGMLLMEVMPDKADKILQALIEFANGRIICRYHNQSDVTHGLVIGSMMIPVLHATTNYDLDGMVNKAKEEYQRILSGDVTPEPTPTPTEKVNTSLAYFIGGYGSCHVDAGEKEMVHRCTKQCTKERHPAIQVNQRVEFTIEGGGVTDDNGKRTGVWEANKAYGIKCPAVKEDVIATITMRNENGVKVLEYRCSKEGSHDDGAGEY